MAPIALPTPNALTLVAHAARQALADVRLYVCVLRDSCQDARRTSDVFFRASQRAHKLRCRLIRSLDSPSKIMM